MAAQEQVYDSPTGWVADHVRTYLETDGRDGHTWNGVPTLLLTTKGRKSGKLRRTALIYGQDGDRFLLVASRGGAPQHPAWYLNLTGDPEVQVQVGADTFTAHASTAGPDEKPRLWQIMTSVWADYDNYQQKTEREIPVVVLERG